MTTASSNLSAEQAASELNAQNERNQVAHQGPTGPRTVGGKQRSSRNAIKFGIFSKATLLKGESRAEYQSFSQGIHEALSPVGALEELLVEKLVSISWRYRRTLVVEVAEIRKNTESLELDRQRSQEHAAKENARRIYLLVELQQGIETKGFDEKHDGALLEAIYGGPAGVPAWPCLRHPLIGEYSSWLETARMTEEDRQSEGCATPEECKRNILQEVRAEIIRLKKHKKEKKKNELIESERTKVEILGQSIPDSPGLDRLLRYESSLERAFDRTLTQMERLQRMRNGHPLPPQIDIKLS